jgi:hypothetical protein
MKRKTILVLAPLASLSWLAAACTEGDARADSDDHAHAGNEVDAVERPQVTFRAGNDLIELPDEVPSGYVDIRVEAMADGDAHLAFGRLVDGTSFDDFVTNPPDDMGSALTGIVGNGTVTPGDEVLLTAELTPGEYAVINIYFNGGDVPLFAFDRFTVVETENPAPAPEAVGTIVLGPGMRIEAPDDFDATGTWKVENHDDTQIHEPAVVGLVDGATTEDLIAWFADPQGEAPPMRGEFGGMGALSPGHEAWVTFEEGDLLAGSYSLICWVPDVNGVPHLMSGMFQDFSVD